ncbi:MAG: hypothetical protein V1856_03520, partial [Candidatus Liptonbacteria bacterium]
TSEQQIAVGESKTYEFRATVRNATATGESVATSLLGDTTDYITGDLGEISANQVIQDKDGTNNAGDDSDSGANTFNFIWSDMSAIPHNDTADGSDDWTNGRYIKIVPTDTQTMTVPG